jgi:thiamine biosynthesis lipoprotein
MLVGVSFGNGSAIRNINNIKTINDSAGNSPVPVRQEIIDLLLFSKEWYEKTDGTTNIALGPVLKIWRDYRENALDDPKNAALPPLDLLETAALYTDINKVILNLAENTVFLENEKMSLDVGAVGKVFATELVVEEIQEQGFGEPSEEALRVLNNPVTFDAQDRTGESGLVETQALPYGTMS